MEFAEGDPIRFPDPHDGSMQDGVFREICDPDETVTVDGRERDAAWASYADGDSEGMVAKVARSQIEPR